MFCGAVTEKYNGRFKTNCDNTVNRRGKEGMTEAQLLAQNQMAQVLRDCRLLFALGPLMRHEGTFARPFALSLF